MKTTAGRGCLLTRITGMLACLLVSGGISAVAAVTTAAPRAFDLDYPKQRLPAPDFSLPELGGGSRSLDDYRGKVVLLHFWATFCAPCRAEIPDLEALWQRYRTQGLVVVGIAADRGNARAVQRFAGEAGVTFPVLLDPDGAVRSRYEVTVLPMSYLVGHDGRLSGRVAGSREWNSPGGRQVIESLLVPAAAE